MSNKSKLVTTADKVQWNTRVLPDFARAAKIVAAFTDFSQDELSMLALAHLFGVSDPAIAAAARTARAAFQRADVKLPTEHFKALVR